MNKTHISQISITIIIFVAIIGSFVALYLRSQSIGVTNVASSSDKIDPKLLSDPVFDALINKKSNGLPISASADSLPQTNPFAPL